MGTSNPQIQLKFSIVHPQLEIIYMYIQVFDKHKVNSQVYKHKVYKCTSACGTTLGKSIVCRVLHVRHSANNEGSHGAVSSTSVCSARDKVCRVSSTWHSANNRFAECPGLDTRQISYLPSVYFSLNIFLYALDNCPYCRVPEILLSAKSHALGI